MKKLAIGAIWMLVTSVPAQATPSTCTGVVDKVGLYPNGYVWADYGFGYHVYCNVNSNLVVYSTTGTPNMGGAGDYTITPATCNSMYSMFLTSKSTGRGILMSYYNGQACTSLGTGNFPVIYPNWISLEP